MFDSFVSPWTIAQQVPLSMEFSRQENWSGLPFPSPGYLPKKGIEPVSCFSRQILNQKETLELSHLESPNNCYKEIQKWTHHLSP